MYYVEIIETNNAPVESVKSVLDKAHHHLHHQASTVICKLGLSSEAISSVGVIFGIEGPASPGPCNNALLKRISSSPYSHQ
jgi:hypothetical protein